MVAGSAIQHPITFACCSGADLGLEGVVALGLFDDVVIGWILGIVNDTSFKGHGPGTNGRVHRLCPPVLGVETRCSSCLYSGHLLKRVSSYWSYGRAIPDIVW
eukprot:15987276-Heterocapsa_arctica.AAC.1